MVCLVYSNVHCTLYLSMTDDMKWSQVQVRGNSPPPLAAHGCAVIGNSVYVFGGLGETGPGDSLHCFDTSKTSLASTCELYPILQACT